jgi:hypothetical protein
MSLDFAGFLFLCFTINFIIAILKINKPKAKYNGKKASYIREILLSSRILTKSQIDLIIIVLLKYKIITRTIWIEPNAKRIPRNESFFSIDIFLLEFKNI